MNDCYTTDHIACGTDYLLGQNAFQAASNDKDHRRPPVLTEAEQISARRREEHRVRNLALYHRKQALKKSASPTIRKVESLRDKMKKAAMRVNKPTFIINGDREAAREAQRDKTAKITGHGTPEARDK